MNKPRFICGSYDVSPEHPSDWSVDEEVGLNSQTTIGGALRNDMTYRKYVYSLIWDAMSVTDYNNLIELIHYSLDNGVPIAFTYDKWPTTEDSVYVMASVSSRDRVGGSGSSGYYSKMTIKLQEIASRI